MNQMPCQKTHRKVHLVVLTQSDENQKLAADDETVNEEEENDLIQIMALRDAREIGSRQ